MQLFALIVRLLGHTIGRGVGVAPGTRADGFSPLLHLICFIFIFIIRNQLLFGDFVP